MLPARELKNLLYQRFAHSKTFSDVPVCHKTVGLACLMQCGEKGIDLILRGMVVNIVITIFEVAVVFAILAAKHGAACSTVAAPNVLGYKSFLLRQHN